MELKVGQVFHLWCHACSPQKNKFFVLATISPGPWFFLINTEPTEFQKKRPHLLSSLISVSHDDAAFLSHDSWIDCTVLLGGHSAQDLETILSSQGNEYLGRLDTNLRRKVRSVVTNSVILSGSEKAHLLASW